MPVFDRCVNIFIIERFRSKSLCDLSYSEKEIKNRSKLLQRMSRENNEQQQQIFKDQAETVYEYTGKSQSLQSLTQMYDSFTFHLKEYNYKSLINRTESFQRN